MLNKKDDTSSMGQTISTGSAFNFGSKKASFVGGVTESGSSTPAAETLK
jgi:hypothetical protein